LLSQYKTLYSEMRKEADKEHLCFDMPLQLKSTSGWVAAESTSGWVAAESMSGWVAAESMSGLVAAVSMHGLVAADNHYYSNLNIHCFHNHMDL